MKVSEAMTPHVQLVGADRSIWEAAQVMLELDAGALPVNDRDGQLVGMITDRDIAVRAVAERKSPHTKVRDVMTPQMVYCLEDEELVDVAANMSAQKVRRLPVLNRDKGLVGIISLGDLAQYEDSEIAGRTTAKVSQMGGPHSQVPNS